ncbi:SDR family NAD(P)-dependent oxidoreductase [Amphibacillus jilinensis]|uniref:SDR family NAD(P)-dependent oxidoreductase n=1 Tax=Amphibacillus jilinensis TaxID=1216008 RepID=UPI000303F214|nr:SDR family oxidoreductase [Amphibacillus jilinensis]
MTIFASDALKGRHVLITGATGGIGFETAKVVADMGARLTITGRNGEKLKQLQDDLKQVMDPASLYVAQADITQADDREQLVAGAEQKLGFISDLVNSAGLTKGTIVEQLDVESISELMTINYLAAFSLTQLIYTKMLEKKTGNIVNVASLSGLRGTHGNSAYASTKFAMMGWTQSMAIEAIKHNIRVNAVCPGFVDTEMAYRILSDKGERNGLSYQETLTAVQETIPSGRMTTPKEVGNAIAFLLTDAVKNIVGESLKISGGTLM